MKKEIILLGYAGHAFTVIEAAMTNNFEISGYFDSEEKAFNPFNLKYLGTEYGFDFGQFKQETIVFPSVGENNIRKKMVDFIVSKKLNEIKLIHTSASIGFQVFIGDSTLVGPHVSVNSLSKIGRACILNTNCVIEHECVVEDFTHIGPGAVLAGNVTVGELTFIGANSTVKQGVKIGRNCIIGAGSVVLYDIPDNTFYVGNPAKYLKENV